MVASGHDTVNISALKIDDKERNFLCILAVHGLIKAKLLAGVVSLILGMICLYFVATSSDR